MKVQRKVMPSEQFYVKEESDSYYIAVDAICMTLALDKREYEPVREWKDMTGVYGGITVNVPGLEDREFKLEITTNGYRLFERREA